MKIWKSIRRGLKQGIWTATMLVVLAAMPALAMAQDDGGEEKKPKKEKPEKPPKEKAPKPEKEPKEKAPKPEKEPKAKPDKSSDESGDNARRAEDDEDDGGGEDGGEDGGKRKKKKKKGDEEATDNGGGANTANERFHANNRDSTTKHGYAVPCARYRRGSMEYIDKNNVFITIRRTRKKEIQTNSNLGQRELKTRKLTRDQKIDKSKAKTKRDRQGNLKDDGNKLIFKIVWVEDCQYKLIFKRSKKPSRYKKGWETLCTITKCYEDYYDCDCDMHDIVQYSSIRKKQTKSEIAQKAREEEEALRAKEAEALAEQEQKLEQARQDSIARSVEDEIFGPIKRVKGDDTEPGIHPVEGSGTAPDPNAKAPETPAAPAAKPSVYTPSVSRPPLIPIEDKKGKKKSKADESPTESEAKVPKEKQEKPPKGDKAPKEKKEKAPKEPKEKKEKAPKEKKEKAPKEPKAPKVKPEKEPKAPKEKPEKAPKEKEEENG